MGAQQSYPVDYIHSAVICTSAVATILLASIRMDSTADSLQVLWDVVKVLLTTDQHFHKVEMVTRMSISMGNGRMASIARMVLEGV